MYIVYRVSCRTPEEASFVSLDDPDDISMLLNKDNDLKEEITHLFNE